MNTLVGAAALAIAGVVTALLPALARPPRLTLPSLDYSVGR